MPDAGRLSPEEALALARAGDPPRARLKIFLGMSAGVGKTYAMLKEAGLLIERGEDVVIGWVEAHGRRDTDALLAGIPKVEPLRTTYRGIGLLEMDLDSVIARRPGIALVDELAHTNAPGSRHPKRYQDVLELLDAGITVYTTVNVQHLESMAESVELVTLAPVRERVPDSVFDRADEVQMVDIPPDELIRRLEEGKVYTGDASREAVRSFFTRGNLAVLREIALRQASQLASHRLLDIMRGESARRPPTLAPRILVAVSSSPNSESLLRWARRLSYSLKAETRCINVESGERLSEPDKERLQKHLDLARSLGARVDPVQNADVVAGIVSYARENAITIIIIGKSGLRMRGRFRKPSISARVIAESGDISVLAVQEGPVAEGPLRADARKAASSPAWHYAAAALAVAATTGLGAIVAGFAGYSAAAIPYLALISLLGLVLERKPVLLAAFLSALAWDFLFIPPRLTFYIGRLEDWLMLALYFVLASTAGWATSRLKAGQRMLELRERRISLLRDLASSLAGKSGLAQVLEVGATFIDSAFDAEAVILLAGRDGTLRLSFPAGGTVLDDKEESAAAYCYKHHEASGRDSPTLPSVAWHFVPMETPNGTIGVVGIRQDKVWTDESELFLKTITRTFSLAIERETLEEGSRLSAVSRESERMSKLILDSVSHELKTPLTVIKGGASILAEGGPDIEPEARASLVSEIRDAADRLDGIVANLLSMNRLESGPMRLRLTDEDIGDLVAAALEATAKELEAHEVETRIPDALPAVACDAGLMTQAMVNVLRNAAAYSGRGSHIVLEARQADGGIQVEIRDDGPGVPADALPHLFEKFYRAPGAMPGGTGLGLSICKGIAEAHGGRIEARMAEPSGLVISITLPAGASA